MILLLDIGNTHTHLGLASALRVEKQANIPTAGWVDGTATPALIQFVGRAAIEGVAVCSVVPQATGPALNMAAGRWKIPGFILGPRTAGDLGIDYPRPETIGPDRLANALALRRHFGQPAVAVDFGTAVTFDVVDRRGYYVGGIIAPGLAVMTSYLHEKTALLPLIKIAETDAIIGKNTEEAMRIGAVHGYRGLIRELLAQLRRELQCDPLPVVATGGYAALMAARLPEITAVEPLLTLEGLRLAFEARPAARA